MTKIRVAIVEDHPLSRAGLRAALDQNPDIEVVGEAADGREGWQLITTTQPDVAIIDIGLPHLDGIELTQKLRDAAIGQQTRILILTLHKDEQAVMAAFGAGADSYITKDASMDNLLQAIHITYEGNTWIDPAIARIVLQQTRQQMAAVKTQETAETTVIEPNKPEYQEALKTCPLTERELEVLALIVAGCTNAQIADKLFITIGTVKTHVRNILSKLCADDRTQAAVRALRSGLVG
ncbi:MAG: response regulator transcription factor [Chloroflexaceae bacterium]|nr:response regulator transcription factor [Chloroflexaceae bacterium]